MSAGYVVQTTIEDVHPRIREYPLFEGDLLVQSENGTFTKECSGLCVVGIMLTEEQIATLKPVTFKRHGLTYTVEHGDV